MSALFFPECMRDRYIGLFVFWILLKKGKKIVDILNTLERISRKLSLVGSKLHQDPTIKSQLYSGNLLFKPKNGS